VICELLGVPAADRDRCRDWGLHVFRAMNDPMADPEVAVASKASLAAFDEYFSALIEERRRAPRDDVLSALVAAEAEDDELTTSDVIANTLLLFGAGHETTMGLIGMAILSLHRHPDELAELRAAGTIAPETIDELGRYESPIQMATRIAGEDVEYGGCTIAAGDHVTAVIGAANRDPARFPDPDRLDPGRDAGRPLTFGIGIHYCLGAPLARMEVEIVLSTLLARTRDWEIDEGGLEWKRDSLAFRGLRALPMSVEPVTP
jgi:cytochrome P450